MFTYNRANLYNLMGRTLSFCDVPYGHDGINANLDAWENKSNVVEFLRKHPDWNEDAMAIITKEEYIEQIDANEVRNKCWILSDKLYAQGHRLAMDRWHGFLDWSLLAHKNITEEMSAKIVGQYVQDLPPIGQKTTRYIRKILLEWGVLESDKNVWDAFQELADVINADQRKVKRTLVISVNPADYLTMSYGTNWASCHIINPDIANTELNSDYDGCYKAGCLSYLGCKCGIITYTVREMPEDVRDLPITPRLTRQMYFLNLKNENPTLLSSRMYPYSNATHMITARREIMESVIDACSGEKHTWKIAAGYESFGTLKGALHYKDYTSFNAYVSYPAFTALDLCDKALIGSHAHCVECGERVYEENSVHCYDHTDNEITCAECGERYDREDMYYIDGEYYCSDCTFWCDYHGCREVERPDTVYYVCEYGYVCESAIDSGDFVREYWSYDYYAVDYTDWVEAGGEYFFDEDDARRAGYELCAECGEWESVHRMHKTLNDEFMCSWCYRHTHTATCEHCGSTYNMHCDEMCPNCGVIVGNVVA